MEHRLYIGTYTDERGDPGLMTSVFSPQTASLSPPTPLIRTPNPSYLARHPSIQTLYAVQETAPGAIHAIDLKSKQVIQTVESFGDHPCHLSLCPKATKLAVANYSSGSIAEYHIQADTTLKHHRTYSNRGISQHTTRQASPHAHCATYHPTNNLLYTTDLGTDEILALSPNQTEPIHRINTPPGSGPRHIIFNPQGTHAFVNTELSNETLEYNVQPNGQLSIHRIHQNTHKSTDLDTSAAILFDPITRSPLVSTRGQDIVTLHLPSNPIVTHLPVQHPRDIALDPSGQFLLAAGQSSNSIAVLRRTSDHEFIPTGKSVQVMTPTCLLFDHAEHGQTHPILTP